MKRIIYIVFIFLGIINISCHSEVNYVMRENQDIPNMQWIFSEKPSFNIDIQDTNENYILGFCIRYNNDYPDANIYLFVHTQFPEGEKSIDTLSIDLFYPDGTPTGSGKYIKELNVNVSQVRFPQIGRYILDIEQASRRDTLQGIAAVGVYLLSDSKNEGYGKEEK